MITPVSNFDYGKISFKTNSGESSEKKEIYGPADSVLNNNFITRTRISLDKGIKAFTVYPAKGLTGSKNSNFYEFLTMGTVPYLVGSATLMGVFNYADKYFAPFERVNSSKIGQKLALGVIFYAILKNLSNSLIDIPVKLKTGIDTELPYAKVIHELQESPNDYNLTSIEYHKIGESVDFPRWDLLYGNTGRPETHNQFFDKIAQKNGLGENLNDSDQEVKPIYKEVLVKSTLAKRISSYLWAGVGVGLAFQKPWEEYFRVATLKFWKFKDFGHSLKIFGESLVESAKQLYKGDPHASSKLVKHSGKILIGVALLSSIAGLLNTLHITKKPSGVKASSVIDSKKESVVC